MNNPCEGCDTPLYIYNDLYDKEDCQRNCTKYQVYLGYQEGLAQGRQGMGKEILDLARHLKEGGYVLSIDNLESYLSERGKGC